jgi:hypothetical protein
MSVLPYIFWSATAGAVIPLLVLIGMDLAATRRDGATDEATMRSPQ